MRKLALLVGAGRYGIDFADLSAPPNDVTALKRVLRSDRLGGFDHLDSLGDASEGVVTRDLFIETLEAAADNAQRDDMFVLYFSGHGFRQNGELVLATSDTIKGSPGTGVRATTVKQFLDNLVCAVKIVILDCCHAGAFLTRLTGKSNSPAQTLEPAEFGRGTWILAASEEGQRAWEADPESFHAGLSAFTAILIQGIETGRADIDEDGAISIEDLYHYTDRELPYNASQRPTLSMLDARRGGAAILTQAPQSNTPSVNTATREEDLEPSLRIISPIFPMVRAERIEFYIRARREEQATKLIELESKLEDIARTSPDPRDTAAYMWVATTCNTGDLEGMERELLWRLSKFEHASDGRRLVAVGFLGSIGHRSMGAYRALVSAITSPRSIYELEEALLIGRTHASAFRGEAARLIAEAALFSLHSRNIPPDSARSHFCKSILYVYFSRSPYARIKAEFPNPKWLLQIARTHMPRIEAKPFLDKIDAYDRGKLDIDQMCQSILDLRASDWYREFRTELVYGYKDRRITPIPIREWQSKFRLQAE
ncbi:caspase family protein [Mesorhizobium sp. B2-3-3]|uniref:caspase family protein n=1 Tax=Streptomyces sp. NPDC088922 TaxID=3156671 RepID=UPI001166BA9C|nr:caspase family protein [Mesorhizobium sp. B2-3-3]